MADLKRLADLIARDVFEVGDERDQPCTRIQFKLGEWPDNETDAGGLCEPSLAGVVYRSLQKHLTGVADA